MNKCSSVLLPDAQTLLNRCRSITAKHALIFQAGPNADTWHLLTPKPLECDRGSMASPSPFPSPCFPAALNLSCPFHKTSLFGVHSILPHSPCFLCSPDTDRSIDQPLSKGMTWRCGLCHSQGRQAKTPLDSFTQVHVRAAQPVDSHTQLQTYINIAKQTQKPTDHGECVCVFQRCHRQMRQ